jgi:hypothetical protein
MIKCNKIKNDILIMNLEELLYYYSIYLNINFDFISHNNNNIDIIKIFDYIIILYQYIKIC